MRNLSNKDCEFSGSAVDPVGRVFNYNSRIFRGIFSEYVEFTIEALSLANKNNWFENGLIPTWKADIKLPGFPLILEHKKIPVVTVRYEWPAEALRSATLCLLELNLKMLEDGYCLKDAHPWNILFDGTSPYFIDWGSICKIQELSEKVWYSEIRSTFLTPLYLFSINQGELCRALLREHKVGVGNFLINQQSQIPIPEIPISFTVFEKCEHFKSLINELIKYVLELKIPKTSGEWVNYDQPRFLTTSHEGLREKDKIVLNIISKDQNKTLLDLGCNYGLHSEYSASLGKRVIACDIEEACIDDLYLRTKSTKVDILVAYLDFLWPNGSSGIVNYLPSAQERLSCDTVLAMAVLHHFCLRQNLGFEAFAFGMSKLSKKKSIVEFIPKEDSHVALWPLDNKSWYTFDNFLAAMLRYFKNYQIVDSSPTPRKIVIFSK